MFISVFLAALQQLQQVAAESAKSPATTTPEDFTMSVEAFFMVLEGKANLLYYQDDELYELKEVC